MNVSLFLNQLFSNRISAFFAADVIVSAAALVIFMYREGFRVGVSKKWLPILALLTVGVSLAFPLFLYMRELQLETRRAI